MAEAQVGRGTWTWLPDSRAVGISPPSSRRQPARCLFSSRGWNLLPCPSQAQGHLQQKCNATFFLSRWFLLFTCCLLSSLASDSISIRVKEHLGSNKDPVQKLWGQYQSGAVGHHVLWLRPWSFLCSFPLGSFTDLSAVNFYVMMCFFIYQRNYTFFWVPAHLLVIPRLVWIKLFQTLH